MKENQQLFEYFFPVISGVSSGIAHDTVMGLSADPRYLMPKYLYDDAGSSIFQEIMKMPEYYLTGCEIEILTDNANAIHKFISDEKYPVDIIEPGSGNGVKTKILLRAFSKDADFRYFPVDISKKANDEFISDLKRELPHIDAQPLTGDWFHIFGTMKSDPGRKRIILFLGSNIGNLSKHEIHRFLSNISAFTLKGDCILIGFDLKKSPEIIMKAYHDPHGLTRKFNLNHLVRINNELHADFDIEAFEHHSEYNPVTGNLKSYLVSRKAQSVFIGEPGEIFRFRQWEPILMEISRKFDLAEINALAEDYGFRVEQNFTDSRKYFVDSLWTKID